MSQAAPTPPAFQLRRRLQTEYDDPQGTAFQGFVTKLSSDGSSLLYSTYLGRRAGQELRTLAIDSQGSVYLGGRATYPATIRRP
jgi:hypothetical protein